MQYKMVIKETTDYFWVTLINSILGYEYEKRAKKALEKLGLTYQDEHELRSKGYDKTPDIKLGMYDFT